MQNSRLLSKIRHFGRLGVGLFPFPVKKLYPISRERGKRGRKNAKKILPDGILLRKFLIFPNTTHFLSVITTAKLRSN